jgi:bifunctional lysine-specific demethylase and histidyl-hydroxylase NO66
VPNGHFRQFEERDAIGPETRVTKRPGLKCRVLARGPRATIEFPDTGISGPSGMLPSLHFIARTDTSFSVRNLPGGQSEEGKIALVRRLVRGG